MNYVSLAVKLSVPVPRDAAEASQTIVPAGGDRRAPFRGPPLRRRIRGPGEAALGGQIVFKRFNTESKLVE
jgi:hypothetical protein